MTITTKPEKTHVRSGLGTVGSTPTSQSPASNTKGTHQGEFPVSATEGDSENQYGTGRPTRKTIHAKIGHD